MYQLEKAVTMTAKSGQFTADKTGKSQFLRGNRRNLAGEGVVRKISSPQRVASVSNLLLAVVETVTNDWRFTNQVHQFHVNLLNQILYFGAC